MHEIICRRVHGILTKLGIYSSPVNYESYTSFLIGTTSIGITNKGYGNRKTLDAFIMASDTIASIGDPNYFEKIEKAVIKLRGCVGCM